MPTPITPTSSAAPIGSGLRPMKSLICSSTDFTRTSVGGGTVTAPFGMPTTIVSSSPELSRRVVANVARLPLTWLLHVLRRRAALEARHLAQSPARRPPP